MSRSEKEINDLIHRALSQEEAEYFNRLGEQSLPEMFTGLFRGRNRWASWLVMGFGVAIFGFSVYALVMFLEAEALGDKLFWQTMVIIGFLGVILMKIWGWSQIDKNATIREIKRLEYQISLLKKDKG